MFLRIPSSWLHKIFVLLGIKPPISKLTKFEKALKLNGPLSIKIYMRIQATCSILLEHETVPMYATLR